MKTIKWIGLFLLSHVVISCSTTMKDTWVKPDYQARSFQKILVIGAFTTLEARNSFENTVVKELADQGIYAETSIELLPPVNKITEMSEEQIVKVVKDGNFDGVIVASLIDVSSKEVRETGGTAIVGPYRYGYGRYAYARYGYVYSADYYRQQNTYVVESSLFDATAPSKEESMIWTGQSGVTDPASIKIGAKEYGKKLVNTLIKTNILKQS